MSGGLAQVAPAREDSRGRVSFVRVSQRNNARAKAFGLGYQVGIDQSQRRCRGVMLLKLARRSHRRTRSDALQLIAYRFDLLEGDRTGTKQGRARLQSYDRGLDPVCRCAAVENEIDAIPKHARDVLGARWA